MFWRKKANVSVMIKSSPEAEDLVGRIFFCHTKDVSIGGIKLLVDIDIPCGAILELGIIFSNSPERHWQMGNVIWCDGCVDESLEQGNWHNIGIRFDTDANPKFNSWIETVIKLLAKG